MSFNTCHQQCMRVSVAPNLQQNLVLSDLKKKYLSHANGFVVLSHCAVNFHFPDD